jgi:hypothetical protein
VVFLSFLAIPIYGVYCLSQMIALQPDIEKAGGSVQLEVVGPQWLKDFATRDYVERSSATQSRATFVRDRLRYA